MNLFFDTKEQLELLFKVWKVTEPLPKKGQCVRVAFPKPAVLNLATVTLHDKRSVYGKPLYKVELSTV